MLKRLFLLLFALPLCASAQQLVTLDMAIQQALQHNFDIQISRIVVEQAEVNNTLGNAGFAPTIDARGGVTASSQNVRNEFLDGRVQEVNNAASVGYNASVNLNWTLFDGGRMFLAKKQLGVFEDLGRAQLKEQVQYIVSEVIQAYAHIVWQQQQGIAIDTGLALALTRIQLSKLKYESGLSAKVDYLQAMVDYKERQGDSLTQKALLTASFATLNMLLGQDADVTFSVQNELELDTTMLPEHKELLEEINPTLAVFSFSAQASLLNAKMAKTAFLPTLALNGGYIYNSNQSQAGFLANSRSTGPTGGLTLNMPLFRGGNIRREAKVASLQANRDQLLYNKQTTEISRQYRTAWRNYEVAVAAYKLQQEAQEYAKENAFIQKERFKAGIATTIETREAETSYVETLVRFYTAAYSLKVNETIVLKLEGALVK